MGTYELFYQKLIVNMNFGHQYPECIAFKIQVYVLRPVTWFEISRLSRRWRSHAYVASTSRPTLQSRRQKQT